jgi:hypothetical protein
MRARLPGQRVTRLQLCPSHLAVPNVRCNVFCILPLCPPHLCDMCREARTRGLGKRMRGCLRVSTRKPGEGASTDDQSLEKDS